MSFSELEADFDYINKLNGKKIILKGNHDYCWNTMSKMNKFIEENGFDTISILHHCQKTNLGFRKRKSRQNHKSCYEELKLYQSRFPQ